MPVVSSVLIRPGSEPSSAAGPSAATFSAAARRSSDFAEADARCAVRSALQASTERPAMTTKSARSAPRSEPRVWWSRNAPATMRAISQAWAIRSKAVAPPMATASTRKRRVVRA